MDGAGCILVCTHPFFSRSDPEFAFVCVDKHLDADPMAPEVYSNANLYFYAKVGTLRFCSALVSALLVTLIVALVSALLVTLIGGTSEQGVDQYNELASRIAIRRALCRAMM